MSWSGGKDSAFALHQLLNDKRYVVKYLLTTIYGPNKRVSMHGVPETLIIQQAESIGIPLKIIYISESTHEEYDIKMKAVLLAFKAENIIHVAFGDIFLEDLKAYRVKRLQEVGMEAIFPLWKRDTSALSLKFIKNGFKTHICSIDASKIPNNLIGVDYSEEFLKELPINIDPCGENGEFHSYCYDGPLFHKKLEFTINGVSEQSYEHDGQKFKYLFSDIS